MSKPDQIIVRDAAAALAEHFSSVQIIAVKASGNGCSQVIASGRGTWHERYGAVREWMITEEEDSRRKVVTVSDDDDDLEGIL